MSKEKPRTKTLNDGPVVPETHYHRPFSFLPLSLLYEFGGGWWWRPINITKIPLPLLPRRVCKKERKKSKKQQRELCECMSYRAIPCRTWTYHAMPYHAHLTPHRLRFSFAPWTHPTIRPSSSLISVSVFIFLFHFHARFFHFRFPALS